MPKPGFRGIWRAGELPIAAQPGLKPALFRGFVHWEQPMVSKCANPACDAQFRYLHQGKLFMVDPISPSEQPDFKGGPGQMSFYWLCDACARELTVKVGKDRDVRLIPRSETRMPLRRPA